MHPVNIDPQAELEMIASYFLSALSVNLRAGTAYGFFSVKRKLSTLSSPFWQLLPSIFHMCDSYSAGLKPLKTLPSMSKINVRVFLWPSQPRWNPVMPKPS
jgi:hypothetical protein